VCCVDTDDISKSGTSAALGALSWTERGESASGTAGGVRGAVQCPDTLETTSVGGTTCFGTVSCVDKVETRSSGCAGA
jgi:hypothetical protein